MGWFLLLVTLAFGGLYAHDRMVSAENVELERDVATLTKAYDELTTRLRDEEERRRIDIEVLVEHQAAETAHLNAVWTKRLAAAGELHGRQTVALKEKLHAYVTPAADARCVVPIGAVLFHNAAARSDSADQGGAALPATPGPVVDTDSGLRLSAVVATVAHNYAGARVALEKAVAEVSAWRSWYAKQSALFNKKGEPTP